MEKLSIYLVLEMLYWCAPTHSNFFFTHISENVNDVSIC